MTSIDLPSIGGYHYVSINNTNPFLHHYFEEIGPEKINKAIVLNIEYNPNELYNKTDGYAGNCWTATIDDSREINNNRIISYNFRNFRDLVAYYEEKGFALLQNNGN